MDNLVQPFVIIRPSGMPFASEILQFLMTYGIKLKDGILIRDWIAVASVLYFDKFGDNETGHLQPGAQAWLQSTAILFGERALVYQLRLEDETNNDQILRSLTLAKKAKLEFRLSRQKMKEKISISTYHLGVQYPVFFDYIHSPDPDLLRLRQEWIWVNNHGKLDYSERCP